MTQLKNVPIEKVVSSLGACNYGKGLARKRGRAWKRSWQTLQKTKRRQRRPVAYHFFSDFGIEFESWEKDKKILERMAAAVSQNKKWFIFDGPLDLTIALKGNLRVEFTKPYFFDGNVWIDVYENQKLIESFCGTRDSSLETLKQKYGFDYKKWYKQYAKKKNWNQLT